MSDYKRNPRSARRARKSLSRKALVVLSLMMVLAVAAVGGTVAWLTDKTETVTNTFTTAGIGITLTETWNTDSNKDGTNDSWSAQLVPGKEYVKNPVVAINTEVTDVPIYLFVKFEEKYTQYYVDPDDQSKGTDEYLTYTSNLNDSNGWKPLSGGIWYRTWKPGDTPTSWHLLDGDKVTVNSALTKEIIARAGTAKELPSLTYTAYAIQQEGFANAAAAWAEVSK